MWPQQIQGLKFLQNKIECLEYRTLKIGILNTENYQVTASTNPVFRIYVKTLKTALLNT